MDSPSPLISTSKHHRISIWRNEVASASLQYDPTSSSPSLAATTAALSSSSASSSSSPHSPPRSLARSALLRGRLLLRRLSVRLARDAASSTVSTVSTASTASSSVWSHRPQDVILRPPCFDDPVFPTAMYSSLRPDKSCLDHHEHQRRQERSPHLTARPRLTESQRRLQRAARLLQRGVKSH